MIKYLVFSLLILPSLAFSQSRAVSIADVSNDIAILRREVGQLRLEVEQLRRENDSLRTSQSGSVSTDVVSAQNGALKSEFDAKLQAMRSEMQAVKGEIIAVTKKDLDALASQTNTAIQKIIASIESKPSAALPAAFSGDFPKTGINYTVQRGDNLSKIASTFKSKVKWIQDANRIENPTSIQVGQSLFIPQN